MTLGPDDIKRAHEIIAAASPAPWHACGGDGSCSCGMIWSKPADVCIAASLGESDDYGTANARDVQKANAAFIAAARTGWLASLDEVERLGALVIERERELRQAEAERDYYVRADSVATQRLIGERDSFKACAEENLEQFMLVTAQRDSYLERIASLEKERDEARQLAADNFAEAERVRKELAERDRHLAAALKLIDWFDRGGGLGRDRHLMLRAVLGFHECGCNDNPCDCRLDERRKELGL